MAINVDSVYQKVLAIANKEQRGYITPLEFNLLANQAQDSIFEQYFYDIKQWNDQQSGNSTEYSDMLTILEEKIAPFKINDAALTGTALFTDDFEADITDWTATNGNGASTHVAPAASNNYNGGLKILQSANSQQHGIEMDTNVALTAGKKYAVSWDIIDISSTAPAYSIYVYRSAVARHVYSTIDPALGSLSFTFIADTTGNHNLEIRNTDSSDSSRYITVGEIKIEEIDDATIGDGGTNTVYRLGEVMWQRSGQAYPTQVPLVNANEITKYNVSPLARPTSSNPVYVRTATNKIQLYPTPSSTDTITHNFIKKPAEVYFGYVLVPQSQGGNEYPLYDAANSVDFELHQSEENTLVYKILELAGIVLNKPGLIQIAAGEEQQLTQEEKV